MSRKPRTTKRRPVRMVPPKPVKLPLSPTTLWRLLLGSFGGLAMLGVILWAIGIGVPQRTALAVATASSEAGFSIRQVAINGAVNQPRLSIYREVLHGGSDSMLLADIVDMRTRLQALPWVLDANVRRRWPDRLEIDIIERKPAAIWQHRQRLRLVDARGDLLPDDRIEDFRHLPLIVGPNANLQAGALLRMLAERPRLRDHVLAGLWIGDRRWDLRMKSGETLSLPEGPAASHALARFDALDQQTQLLGRGFVRFDMRIPEKMVVRVSDEAGAKARSSSAQARRSAAPQVRI